MKLLLTSLSLSLLGLVACASTGDPYAAAPPADDATPSLLDEDEAYMAYVERVARRRGIEVVWINVPTKRPADELASE